MRDFRTINSRSERRTHQKMKKMTRCNPRNKDKERRLEQRSIFYFSKLSSKTADDVVVYTCSINRRAHKKCYHNWARQIDRKWVFESISLPNGHQTSENRGQKNSETTKKYGVPRGRIKKKEKSFSYQKKYTYKRKPPAASKIHT